jgi:hypothetical protein
MDKFRKEIVSATDILDFINRIELDLKPQDWKVEGIDIWPILRISIYYELSMKILNSRNITKNKLKKIARVLSAISYSFNNYKVKSTVLFVSDGISYINIFDKLYERFCDPLIEILEEENISWEKWDIANELSLEKHFKSNSINRPLDLLILKSKLTKPYHKYKNIKFIDILCDYIKNNTTSFLWNTTSIQNKINAICLMVNWYKKQLIHNETKLVLLVSYYSDRGMALIKACKDLGIKTADIQHGIQGELHAAYGNWLDLPLNGYNTIPDTFLVWSEDEAMLNKNSVIIGNVFESKWHACDGLANRFDDVVVSISKKLKANKNILFTVQYGIEYTSKQFELIKNTQYEFNWFIRLHPVMSNNDKESFIHLLQQNGIENYEIKSSTFLPLYALLRNVNVHITHSSSTVIEALNFQVPSLLIDNYGREYYSKHLCDLVKYESEIENQIITIRKFSKLAHKNIDLSNNVILKKNFKDYIHLNS